jgi:hypothetical protein
VGKQSRLKKARRLCIFCEREGLSKEHIWSEWMHPILGIRPEDEALEFVRVQARSRASTTQRVRNRQGSTATKTVRAVCKACNSGWMNRIEQETRPLLEPLLLGTAVELAPEAREQVARWITMKLMVGEHALRELAVVPQSDRGAFMQTRAIPDAVKIWIGRNDSTKWKHGWQRHAATLVWPGEPAPKPFRKTVQTTTFGAGRLLVFALISYLAGYQHGPTEGEANLLPRLWPLSQHAWPPGRTETDAQADHLASAFHGVLDQPNVHWFPEPMTEG